ncbi:hypothetical protein NFI96_006482 [Prochilodus magdalenae]|nr:hypothetical protein NFI96_006482 [Prochilodus magdalenae]
MSHGCRSFWCASNSQGPLQLETGDAWEDQRNARLGVKRGVCSQINHFPEDADFDHDGAEYVLRVVRASNIFPILSAILLLMGGVCIAASRFYKSKRNIILGAGILFVAAGP